MTNFEDEIVNIKRNRVIGPVTYCLSGGSDSSDLPGRQYLQINKYNLVLASEFTTNLELWVNKVYYMHEELLGKVLKIVSYFGINSRWQKIPLNRVLCGLFVIAYAL